jgi:hypothetical protein
VPSDSNILATQFARNHAERSAGSWFGHDQEFWWEAFTKPSVDLANRLGRYTTAPDAPVVDPARNLDVSPGFKLKVALCGILAVVIVHRAFDVYRMGVVPFDEV